MPTLKVSIPADDGLQLSGRLELPDGEPEMFAIFSHCFTCTKDVMAAYRISKNLASLGIATLRYDFGGLGDSDGEFVDTCFSSNMRDLQAAAAFLDKEYAAPNALVGHSMGGTVSLAVASDIDSVRCVATIASPSQPSHVLHHFTDAIAILNTGKNTEIKVGGQMYEVAPIFVDDILQHDIEHTLAASDKPALIFRVEGDDIVATANADDIVGWAADGSRIVDLDSTDHLISDRQTAMSIAEQIAGFIRQH